MPDTPATFPQPGDRPAVLVTRPQPGADRLAAVLRGHGLTVLVAPLMRVVAVAHDEAALAAARGLVFTSAHAIAAAGPLRAERPSPTAGLTASLLELHARAMTIAVRHARAVERFVAVHDDVDLALVPTEATDVHDLEGLRLIGDRLGR